MARKYVLLRRFTFGLGLLLLSGLALIVIGFAVLHFWPAAGAQGADWLRRIVGDRAAAQVETAVFQTQDFVHQKQYKLTQAQPVLPWEVSPLPAGPAAHPGKPSGPALDVNLAPGKLAAPGHPADLNPLGNLKGEGRWSPYLNGPDGQPVAYRTYLQPDPTRPYTLVALVAFDLQRLQLHFVLGTQEPASPVPAERTGQIPASDLSSGLLLAAFNGGFKANQGHFGAMVDGVTVLPPIDGLGTVAMYSDGRVRIGAWGSDITPSSNMLAWRQNGPLLIQNGKANPRTAVVDPKDWGYTVGGETTTWRSALGISADGRTLIYAAGPDLTLPSLTQALHDAGAGQAVQLDINDYWVHFDAIQAGKNGLETQPLFTEMQTHYDQRYLKGFTRDFFYITAGPMPPAAHS